MNLNQIACEFCTASAQPLPANDCEALLELLEGWNILLCEGVQQLHKTYLFGDFSQALAFTNAVGELAERDNHHPALLTEWGKVGVSWWTHSAGGLQRNDFIMAARTEALSQGAIGLRAC